MPQPPSDPDRPDADPDRADPPEEPRADAGPREPTAAHASAWEPPPDPSGEPEPGGPAPQGLLRSGTDRVLFGVCGGVGRRLDVEAWLVRVLVVVLTFVTGGAAILAYLAAALLVPRDGAPAVDGRDGATVLARAVVLAAAGLAALVLMGVLAVLGGLTAAVGGAWVVGVVVLVLAGLLVAFARDRRSRWLLVPIVALAVPTAVVAASGARLDDGVDQRYAAPRTAADVPAGGYRLGAGQQIVDLDRLRLDPDRPVRISARVSVGQLVVALPEDRCVEVWLETDDLSGGPDATGATDVSARGLEPVGAGRWRTEDVDADAPELDLDLETGAGQVRVTRVPGGRERGRGDREPADPCRG